MGRLLEESRSWHRKSRTENAPFGSEIWSGKSSSSYGWLQGKLIAGKEPQPRSHRAPVQSHQPVPRGFVAASSSRGHVWDRPLSHLSPPRGSLPVSNPKQGTALAALTRLLMLLTPRQPACAGGADVWKEKKGKGCMEGGGGWVFLKKAWSKKSGTGGRMEVGCRTKNSLYSRVTHLAFA